MGAWDIGNFDNDDAADLISDIEEAKSVAPIAAALREVEASTYIEAPEASRALAAAEIVAAITGHAAPDLPDSASAIVSKLKKQPPDQIIELARNVTSKILEESELRELWADTRDFDAWQATERDLISRLG